MELKSSASLKRGLILKALIALFFMCCLGAVHAQDVDPSEQPQNNTKPTTKAQKAEAKKAKERAKASKKATKAALKQHMKDQTPEVRKRMKRDAHQAKLNNEHRREFFLKRWFTRKKPG